MTIEICIDLVIEKKLRDKHAVELYEVVEAFGNRMRESLIDTRAEHKSDPATKWFCSETDAGRPLKVIYVEYVGLNKLWIKTARQPSNPGVVQFYERKARLI